MANPTTTAAAATTALLVYLCLLISAAAKSPPPVLDIQGQPLRTNTNYFILPVFRGRGGGLTLTAATNASLCPLVVAQARSEVDNGLPLTFTPANSQKGVITESTDLNVKFSTFTICVVSTVWKLAGPDKSKGNYFVSIGGVEGKHGRETAGNWFKIVKNGERDYNLRFCPTVDDSSKVMCRDVGISIDGEGKRRLVLSDNPFLVFFKKAKTGIRLSSDGIAEE